MNIDPSSYRKKTITLIIFIVFIGLTISLLLVFPKIKEERNFSSISRLAEERDFFVQGNSLVTPNNPSLAPSAEVKKLRVILTAYSSSPDETWGNPFITASGEQTRTGIVANNCLPFGTIVEIGGKQFEVLDRKNSRYGCEWFDIWQPSKEDALNFGIKKEYIKVF